ncbi:hypothetical protein SLEP1_g26072 [Rubroshorea leprosula]|uniref:Uncharacterized protein n=1 Tax=Rubroshorea leprosula TaxID=152421 RepID=A0AAV5JT23_9ROSI|nr:hypothetical protein SLEP1_g26072 [Rubroshorea leprosula]
MMSIIFRRSSTPGLAAASAAIQTLQRHYFSVAASISRSVDGVVRPLASFPALESGFGINKARNFHAKTRPLNFRASPVSRAEFAVHEYTSSFGEDKAFKAANDNTTSDDDGLEIAKLGISQEIISSLSKRGITKLFPIQRAVLEPAMQGRDMIGRARTGTGKTLAFGIPIIDKIIRFKAKNGVGRNPLCLVLAPTRELAKQVEKEFHESATSLDTICVYGGTPISRQMRELDYGVDVAVGTPGRIIDLLNRGSLNLSEVQFLVLDEADQMLQVGFAEDVERILDSLPENRQSMMFSATMPNWIKELTRKYLKDPLTIDLVGDSDKKLAEGISLYSITSDMYGKASIIGPLITEHANGGKCIVFTQTKRDADRLAYAMSRSYRCEALHGDISQSQRERTLSNFREGHCNILVATDVAARGLDVPNVDLVIHYELPNTSETFVHRTGRTGRAGKTGAAILIYTSDQARAVKVIERDVGCRFTELPRIAIEAGSRDMLSNMSPGVRSGSFGGVRDRRFGETGFVRSGGQGESGFGRSGSYRSSRFGRTAEGGQFSAAMGSYGGSGSGRFGSNANRSGNFGRPGFSRSGGFGEMGRADRSSDFGGFGSGRSSRFGDSGSGHTGGFSDNLSGQRSGGFDSGRSRTSGFGDFGSGRTGGLNDNYSGRSSGFGSFGETKLDSDQGSGRKLF